MLFNHTRHRLFDLAFLQHTILNRLSASFVGVSLGELGLVFLGEVGVGGGVVGDAVAFVEGGDVLDGAFARAAGLGVILDGAGEDLAGLGVPDRFELLAGEGQVAVVLLGEGYAAVGVVPGVVLIAAQYGEGQTVDVDEFLQRDAQCHSGEHIKLHQCLTTLVVGTQWSVPRPFGCQGGERFRSQSRIVLRPAHRCERIFPAGLPQLSVWFG